MPERPTIGERLRSPEFADVAEKYLMIEAAAEIERLREALVEIANFPSNDPVHIVAIARRVLEEGK